MIAISSENIFILLIWVPSFHKSRQSIIAHAVVVVVVEIWLRDGKLLVIIQQALSIEAAGNNNMTSGCEW